MTRLLLAVVFVAACGTDDDGLTVTIDTGVVHGGTTDGIRHFFAIPYAAPPIGDLRFRAPQPAAPWSGVREALETLSPCPQSMGLSGASNDEDCLFVNVWAPAGAHDLPVLVFIHGGAFVFGSGGDKYYAGDKLAKRGAVVVTMNYRLGPFGFLAHPQSRGEDPAFPTAGNYGFEDQRASLEWVQRNIAAFGGDPAHVMLFGESAGGFSTCVQYVSSRTHGLFEAAISESGLCAGKALELPRATAEANAAAFATQLGCAANDATTLACLRGKSADELLNATALPMPAQEPPGGPLYLDNFLATSLPSVDGYVIEHTLAETFAGGQFEPRPFILGTNKDEGTLFHSVLFAKAVTDETQYRDALTRRFGAGNVDAIVAMYPIASYASPNAALAEVTGDAFFVCPARSTARGAAKVAPTYRYTFQRMLDNPLDASLGVIHSAEIPFVFDTDAYPLGVPGSGRPLVDAMQGYWLALATGGDPNTGAAVPWPRYDASEMSLVLDVPVSTVAAYKAAQCDFWDALPLPN